MQIFCFTVTFCYTRTLQMCFLSEDGHHWNSGFISFQESQLFHINKHTCGVENALFQ